MNFAQGGCILPEICYDKLVRLKSGSSSGVEHQLPKLRVAGSNPVSRSREIDDFALKYFFISLRL